MAAPYDHKTTPFAFDEAVNYQLSPEISSLVIGRQRDRMDVGEMMAPRLLHRTRLVKAVRFGEERFNRVRTEIGPGDPYHEFRFNFGSEIYQMKDRGAKAVVPWQLLQSAHPSLGIQAKWTEFAATMVRNDVEANRAEHFTNTANYLPSHVVVKTNGTRWSEVGGSTLLDDFNSFWPIIVKDIYPFTEEHCTVFFPRPAWDEALLDEEWKESRKEAGIIGRAKFEDLRDYIGAGRVISTNARTRDVATGEMSALWGDNVIIFLTPDVAQGAQFESTWGSQIWASTLGLSSGTALAPRRFSDDDTRSWNYPWLDSSVPVIHNPESAMIITRTSTVASP